MKRLIFCFVILTASMTAALGQRPALTAADYARAEKMLSYNTEPLVDRNGVRATWLPDGRFFYRVLTASGSEYVVVDPKDGSRKAGATLAELGVSSAGGSAARVGRRGGSGDPATSPDGKRTAFIKDFNLWVLTTRPARRRS